MKKSIAIAILSIAIFAGNVSAQEPVIQVTQLENSILCNVSRGDLISISWTGADDYEYADFYSTPVEYEIKWPHRLVDNAPLGYVDLWIVAWEYTGNPFPYHVRAIEKFEYRYYLHRVFLPIIVW